MTPPRSATLGSSLALALAVLGGCASAPIFNTPARHPIGEVCARTRWRASGSLPAAGRAIDGDLQTVAHTDAPRAGTALAIDLSKVCLFNLAALDHGPNQQAFARGVEIRTSLDGKTFTTRHVAPGTRRVTTLLLPKAVLARYVEFRVVEPGPGPWAVAEVYFQ